MPYPKSFYYTETQSLQSYQRYATGKPSIARLIRGYADYWISPSPPRVEKKKKLILVADWWSFLNKEDMDNALMVFERLINDGFELYVWQAGNLKSLTKEILFGLIKKNSLLYYLHKSSSLEGIDQKILSQHGLSRDKIHLLDFYEFDALLAGDDSRFVSHSLSVARFCNVPLSLSGDCIKWLSLPGLKPSILLLDVFSKDGIAKYLSLAKKFPGIITQKRFRELELNDLEIVNLLSEERKSISREGIDFDFDKLGDIETLNLSNTEVKLADIEKLLLVMPKLKSLSLKGCSNLVEEFRFSPAFSAQIETLNLKYCSISNSNLVSLLKRLPNLKEINLKGRYELDPSLELEAGDLPKLEKLDLRGRVITSGSLKIWLKAAPNLKEIDFSYCDGLDLNLELGANDLPKLEKLNFKNTKITATSLKIWLKAAPNLKEIKLSNCEEGDLGLELGVNDLSELTQLDLSGSKISIDAVLTWMLAAPNLREIHLGASHLGDPHLGDPHLGDPTLVLLENSLPNLRVINLNEHFGERGITVPALRSLLKAAPKLTEINILSRCVDVASELLVGNLSDLRLLSLHAGEYNKASSLQALLMATHNLEIFSLSSSVMNDEPMKLSKGSLPRLTMLNLNYAHLSGSVFHALLKAASNLREINLESCELNGVIEELDEGCLPELTRLNLAGCNITTSNLELFLKAASNLRIINFYGHVKLAKDLSLGQNSLLALTELDLSSSDSVLASDFITVFNLQVWLKAAPNLKQISLRNSRLTDAVLSLSENSLLELRELDLSYSTITASNLQALLKAAPNLRKINLIGSRLMGAVMSLAKDSLLELKVLLEAASKLPARDEYERELTEKASLGGGATAVAPVGSAAASGGGAAASGGGAAASVGSAAASGGGAAAGAATFTEEREVSIEGEAEGEASSALSVDADTKLNPDTVFHVSRFFYSFDGATPPAVNHYRLRAFQSADLNEHVCNSEEAFSLSNEGDLGLVPCEILRADPDKTLVKEGGKNFYATQRLTLSREWQPLASLSAREELLCCNTSPDVAVEIQYSARDNLYYIRAQDDRRIIVNINFSVHIPTVVDTWPEGSESIKALVREFLSYTSGELSFAKSKTELTGKDYLEAIIQQKKGACRHRALAFKALMTERYPHIPVRIIVNDCHAYVELKLGEQWIACDLGGYPAKIEIHETREMNKALVRGLKMQTPQQYYQYCLNGEAKSVLIECSTAQDAEALHFGLMKYCRSTSRPVFYVNSPDDLICSAAYMYRHADGRGELRSGPGGALYNFLQANPTGVLIVNYGHFKSDDLVRFNALVDKVRKADGVEIAKDIIVVGLLPKDKEEGMPGSDFYSRFERVETCTLKTSVLEKTMPPLPEMEMVDVEGSAVINLYHAADWEIRLLGSWVPNEGGWYYEEGELQKALASGATQIEIQNGLWENPDFCRFWRELKQSGVITHEGIMITVPDSLRVVQREGYDWTKLKRAFQQVSAVAAGPVSVLNLSSLAKFFGRYEVDGKNLRRDSGYIELAVSAGKPAYLPVYLTQSLSEDNWAMLLQSCVDHDLSLQVYCAPGVDLPAVLQAPGFESAIIPEALPWLSASGKSTELIASDDPDVTLAHVLADNPESVVIDVSECDATDLLSRTDATFIHDALRFEFSTVPCALVRALSEGKTVVLTGRFSENLANELAPLLLQRIQEGASSGRLFLVSEDTEMFNYFPCSRHTVSMFDKHRLLQERLGGVPTGLMQYLPRESFSKLLARARFIHRHPGVEVSSDESWAGLEHLSVGTKDPGEHLELDSAEKAWKFTENRRKEMNAVLTESPYVFLTGLSGVGKTTFVIHEFCGKNDELYQGESSLLAWAKNKGADTRKILFLDEANLRHHDWSLFEGLFNEPPAVLINGEYCVLTPQHKVIFAGNPTSYGDERKLAPFFKRHGNAVVFEPLPIFVLYEHVLKPLFEDSLFNETQKVELSKILLEVYRFCCLYSASDILISPRELQMMALLTISYCSRHPDLDPKSVTQYFAYHMMKHALPKDIQTSFGARFKTETSLVSDREVYDDFLITPSRQRAVQLLDECLNLREIRPEAVNEAQRYGGLGGIVLEGEPGIGKSELVIAALRARGYVERRALTAAKSSEKYFYHIAVSMPLAEKESLLRTAFDEGAVVVIDEINSSPMMEQVLNAVLTGRTPEGARPTSPGFMIIGTQNPVSMAGRRALSPAVRRRMLAVELPAYDTEEMKNILVSRSVPESEASKMVEIYEKRRDFAKTNNIEPAPTFRDLLREAGYVVESIQRAERERMAAASVVATATTATLPVAIAALPMLPSVAATDLPTVPPAVVTVTTLPAASPLEGTKRSWGSWLYQNKHIIAALLIISVTITIAVLTGGFGLLPAILPSTGVATTLGTLNLGAVLVTTLLESGIGLLLAGVVFGLGCVFNTISLRSAAPLKSGGLMVDDQPASISPSGSGNGKSDNAPCLVRSSTGGARADKTTDAPTVGLKQ